MRRAAVNRRSDRFGGLDLLDGCQRVILIGIRRGFIAFGISRTSSMVSKPLSKDAPLTCTQSARLNWRLNGR